MLLQLERNAPVHEGTPVRIAPRKRNVESTLRLKPHLWKHLNAFGFSHRQSRTDALVKTGWWCCGRTLTHLGSGDLSHDCLQTLSAALHEEDLFVVLPHLHPAMHRDHVITPDYDRIGRAYAAWHAELIVTKGIVYGVSKRFRKDKRFEPLGRFGAWHMIGQFGGRELPIFRMH